jgi:hypothetical protein
MISMALKLPLSPDAFFTRHSQFFTRIFLCLVLPLLEIFGPPIFFFLFHFAGYIRDLKMSTALTSAQREVIERQHFQPLPEPERQWVKDLQDLLPPLTPLPDRPSRTVKAAWEAAENARRAQMHVETEHVQFTIGDFGTLFENEEQDPEDTEEPIHLKPISDKILGTYFDFIIRYKNQTYHDSVIQDFEARHPPKQNKKAKKGKKAVRDRGGASKARRRSASPEPDSDDSEPPQGPHRKVAYISNDTFSEAMGGRRNLSTNGITTRIERFLADLEMTVSQVQELDYLFLPYFFDAHHVLMGIAPKQGFTFIIDSCQWARAKEEFPVKYLMALALHLCPADKEWPIFGKWAIADESDPDSLLCAKQGDLHNCGVFTSTNMMCLSFGYRLMCYRNRDLDVGKRHRIAAEIAAGGFGEAPFDYQILDVPESVAAYRTGYQYQPPQGPAPAGPAGPAGSAAPSAAPNANATGAGDTEDEEDGYSQTEDEYLWSDDDYDDDYDPNAGALPADRRYPSTRMRFKFHPKEDTPTIEKAKASEMLWPAQFDSTYYKKAGFVYKTPVNIAEIHLESKSSILRACKRFGVKNYGFWSREPLKMFRRWFQNEVAGNINILTKGLKPMGHGENLPKMAKDCRKQRRTQLLGNRLRRRNNIPLATIKRHLEKRRSFGERGRGAKPKRKCAVNGCSLEFEHEGLHLVL